MNIILNTFEGSTNFEQALRELVRDADTLSLAVSYLQLGGWELFRRNLGNLSLPKMRIVCTDQFGITQPAAVERALASDVKIRNFVGNVVYHPKLFLAHDLHGKPTRFLLGSANLSASAFSQSIEAGLLSDDAASLSTLHRWFNDLFEHCTEAFTPELLHDMELRWRVAAAARAHRHLMARATLMDAIQPRHVPIAPEDLDTLDDILATIQLPIGLLNMDYAANNIRNITKAREFMANPHEASDKQRSELKLLGFMLGGTLTALGDAAAGAKTNEEFARLWCAWLRRTPNHQLEEINQNLLIAKRVFPQFWRLREDVQDYFLENARTPDDRIILQTIELLCNTDQVVRELTLDDIRTLSSFLRSERVPAYIANDVEEYFANKGTRSWNTDDRRVVPLAWKDTEPN